jgi:hypothetical protein
MGGVSSSSSGCLTDATHVFGYVRHTRKVGRDSAAAAAAVRPARAAADAIARYVAQSSVVVVVPVETTESGGAEDEVEVGQGGNSKIVIIAVCAVCTPASTCRMIRAPR